MHFLFVMTQITSTALSKACLMDSMLVSTQEILSTYKTWVSWQNRTGSFLWLVKIYMHALSWSCCCLISCSIQIGVLLISSGKEYILVIAGKNQWSDLTCLGDWQVITWSVFWVHTFAIKNTCVIMRSSRFAVLYDWWDFNYVYRPRVLAMQWTPLRSLIL